MISRSFIFYLFQQKTKSKFASIYCVLENEPVILHSHISSLSLSNQSVVTYIIGCHLSLISPSCIHHSSYYAYVCNAYILVQYAMLSCKAWLCQKEHTSHFCRLCDQKDSQHLSRHCPEGVILYHGTTSSAVEIITEEGLRSRDNGRWGRGIYGNCDFFIWINHR